MDQFEDPFMLSDDNTPGDSDNDFFKDLSEEELKKISDQYVEYLRLIKDNWSSCHAAKIFNDRVIRVRILTSFLYIKDHLRVESQKQLLKILKFAETDANEWVKKMGKLVVGGLSTAQRPYVNTGVIDLRLIDTETAFRIITFLDEKLLESAQDEYLKKPGIDEVHICNPNNFDFDNPNTAAKNDEYTLYTPRHNFDSLGEALVRRALATLRETYSTHH